MGLLDGGLERVFGAAFGGLYLRGCLQRVHKLANGKGGWVEETSSTPVRVQVDACTEAMRQAAGYTDRDVRLLVLRHGVRCEPTTDDRVIVGRDCWAVRSVDRDAANTHWVVRGSPA